MSLEWPIIREGSISKTWTFGTSKITIVLGVDIIFEEKAFY